MTAHHDFIISVAPEDAAVLAEQIPEMEVTRDIAQAWRAEGWTCLVAQVDGQYLGYMTGKRVDSGDYFIWLCGVLPSHRRQGICAALLEAHEQEACRQGCPRILIDSKNKYPSMLMTLIKNGYVIWNVIQRESWDRHSIQFEKRLTRQSETISDDAGI